MKMCEYVVTTYVDTAMGDMQLSMQDRRIFIRFIKFECFGACIEWLNDGMNDDIMQDLHRCLSSQGNTGGNNEAYARRQKVKVHKAYV